MTVVAPGAFPQVWMPSNTGQTPPFRPGPVGVGLPPQNQFGQANAPVVGGPQQFQKQVAGMQTPGINPNAPQASGMPDLAGQIQRMQQESFNGMTSDQLENTLRRLGSKGVNDPSMQQMRDILAQRQQGQVPNLLNGGNQSPPFNPNAPQHQNQRGRQQPQQLAQQPQQLQALQTGQQFGLGGAEQALQAGTLGGINAIGAGRSGALNMLQGGFGQATDFINRGVAALGGGGGFGGGGFGGGGGGGGGASAQRAGAASLNENTGQGQFREGIQGVQQFQDAGLQAQQRQLALSGALGQEAFDAARINDPAQAFLREQGELSIVNQNAATGGLGGGAIGRELARFGQGLASQNLQQERNAVNQLSSQGLQAAGQAGQLLGQSGSLQGQLAGQQASLINQVNMQNAQLGTQASIANASNQTQAGIAAGRNATALRQSAAGLFGQGAGLAGQFAGQGAGFQMGAGQNIANILGNAGRTTAGFRFDAGRNISNTIGQTTGQLAGFQNQQGRGVSDIVGAGGVNLSNLITGAGNAAGGNQAQIAALLANLTTGQGTTAGNLQLQQGQANAQAQLNQGQGQTALIGDLLKLYNSQGQSGGTSLGDQALLDIESSQFGGGL